MADISAWINSRSWALLLDASFHVYLVCFLLMRSIHTSMSLKSKWGKMSFFTHLTNLYLKIWPNLWCHKTTKLSLSIIWHLYKIRFKTNKNITNAFLLEPCIPFGQSFLRCLGFLQKKHFISFLTWPLLTFIGVLSFFLSFFPCFFFSSVGSTVMEYEVDWLFSYLLSSPFLLHQHELQLLKVPLVLNGVIVSLNWPIEQIAK